MNVGRSPFDDRNSPGTKQGFASLTLCFLCVLLFGFESFRLSYPNGVTNVWQYDALNRLTNLVWKSNATTSAAFAYQLGAVGNRTRLDETVNGSNRVYQWSYDTLYRLKNEIITGAGSTGAVAYAHDPVGNRTNRASTLSALTNQVFSYNTNDWLTIDTFDSAGNTRTNAGNPFFYDWANRLTNAVIGTTNVSIVYNGDGQRVKKTVVAGATTTITLYLVDSRNPSGYAQVMEELSVSGGSTNLARAYTYGLDLISQRAPNTSTNFFGVDGLGSTRLLLNLAGGVSDTYTYDAFGTVVASTGTTTNHYLYAGEQRDADLGGLYYLRAPRYLNTGTGRFTSMDSFEGTSTEPLSLHKYLYAHADPVNLIDPSGYSVNFNLPSLLTAVGAIATLASQQLSVISRQAGPLFAAGGRHVWVARQAFGRFAENTAYQVVRLIQTSVQNLHIAENVQRGSRYIDIVLRHGQRVMDLEVKYKLPDRAGKALTRLVSHAQSSVAAAEAQTVIWTFKEPTLRELNLVTKELGTAANRVQFVHGVEGLLRYIDHFFGF